jgi:uncharacterized protein involved in type VI secretion and phage assembly
MLFESGISTNRKDKGHRPQFWGKYRAVVSNNKDPKKMGRVKVKCPKVLGDFESDWALPCFPFGGSPDRGIVFMPKVGQGVWVEFEEGDPNLPIWVGSWFGKGHIPPEVYTNNEVGYHHVIDMDNAKIYINEKAGTINISGSHSVIIDSDLTVRGAMGITEGLSVLGNIQANGTIDGSNI